MYRMFTRTWWADDKCTIPRAGRKSYDPREFSSEADAQAACRGYNLYTYGSTTGRGPRGMCAEYEES